MKALVPLLLVVGVLPLTARVGEPLAELERRYGACFCEGPDQINQAFAVYGFDQEGTTALRRRGFAVQAVLDSSGRCQELDYIKAGSARLAVDEVRGILISNAQGKAWETKVLASGDVRFVRSDGLVALEAEPGRFEVMSAQRAQERGIAVE